MIRLCAAVALATTLGCQSQHIGPSPGLGDPYPSPLNDPQISVLSPELQPWLRFHPARIDQPEGRPMQVEVPVRNLADREYLIDYRVIFFDANDLELRSTMGWTFLALKAKQTARLQAGSLSADAVTYRLEVKWAR